MNWYSIIVTILMVIGGFLAQYFRTKQELWNKVNGYIDKAEETYADVTKAGQVKFNYVVDVLSDLVPLPLRVIITRETIANIVQKAVDAIASYATKQLDKVVDNVIKE